MNARHKQLWVVVTAAIFLATITGGFYLKKELVSQSCLQNLASMAYEGRIWAQEHGDRMPTNFLCFSAELISPTMMICLGDHGRAAVRDWAQFDSEHSSYELVGSGVRLDQTNQVFIRCKTHGYVCYVGGAAVKQ